jgi:hypothetical protein
VSFFQILFDFNIVLYMRQVRVFEQTSRGESMVLTLGDQGRPDIAEVARALIGKQDGDIYCSTHTTVTVDDVVIVRVADPDPGSGAFLTPDSESRTGKKSESGSVSRIRDEQPELYFRELRNHFLG